MKVSVVGVSMEVSISGHYHKNQSEQRLPSSSASKNSNKKPQKARENAADQFTNGFRFASNWPKGWRGFSKPITDRRNAKSR